MHRTESSKTTGLNTQLLPRAIIKHQTFWVYTNKLDLETPSIPTQLHSAVFFSRLMKDRKPQTQKTQEKRSESPVNALPLCNVAQQLSFSPSASGGEPLGEPLGDSGRAPGLPTAPASPTLQFHKAGSAVASGFCYGSGGSRQLHRITADTRPRSTVTRSAHHRGASPVWCGGHSTSPSPPPRPPPPSPPRQEPHQRSTAAMAGASHVAGSPPLSVELWLQTQRCMAKVYREGPDQWLHGTPRSWSSTTKD